MSKKEQQKPEEKKVFGDEAEETRCPFCGTQTITEVAFVNTAFTIFLAISCFLLLGILFSMIVVPLIFVFTKQLVHKCGACEEEIGTNGELIYGSGIRDGVVSLKIGEIGFILTKKILSNVFAGGLFFIILYYKIFLYQPSSSYGHSHLHEKITWTNTTWEQYISDCGIQNIDTHAKYHECEKQYIDQTVKNWDGYIIRVEDYRQTLYQYLHHAVSILVKMEKTETDAHADILLTFDSEMVDIYQEALNNISRGDHISFNATIKSIGNVQQTRHLHVINIQKEEGRIEIPAHIHNGGRYDDTPRRMRGKADEPPAQIKQAEANET